MATASSARLAGVLDRALAPIAKAQREAAPVVDLAERRKRFPELFAGDGDAPEADAGDSL